jgi:hypothetical protein
VAARILLLIGALLAAAPAAAQATLPLEVVHTGPAMSAEVITGWAGFVDDGTVNHAIIGGSARMQLGGRVSVGPELVYMRGPGFDRDLFITGNVIFDVRRQAPGYPPRVSPFVVVGAGGFRHSDRFGTQDFSSWEGTITGGGGVRVLISQTVFAVAEARLGWEPHLRITGGIGILTR